MREADDSVVVDNNRIEILRDFEIAAVALERSECEWDVARSAPEEEEMTELVELDAYPITEKWSCGCLAAGGKSLDSGEATITLHRKIRFTIYTHSPQL